MDSPFQAPPVVAVVVTCDPGPWLEEALAALDAQDYPNLSFLVIDAGSAEDPTPRVAAALSGAYVRRLPTNPGFAAAANEVLSTVEGASHLLVCHDDVAPAPDAVRLMVEEAFRSNAGVVAPKLVDWEDPRRLLQVGMGIDKSAAPSALVDRGELDQEQHDGVRDVFVAPGGCTLVRADLFASLGGFDPVMHLYGEDVDLSWRAQLAGARVVVAPAARVRHLEAMSSGRRSPGGGPLPGMAALRRRVRPLQLRHRLRAVLKCYSGWHLVRVLPQVAVLAVAEMIFGFVTGHVATARDTAAAWSWNLRRLGEVRAARLQVGRARRVGDAEVRRLQARGSARFSALVRGQLAAQRFRRQLRRPAPVAEPTDEEAPELMRLRLGVIAGVALVLVVGSRHLITGGIPAVHELAPFPDAASFLRSFLSGWRQTGLGADAPAPPAFALLGLGGVALGGATGLLRTLLVVGALPVGVLGAFRLAAPLGSPRARLAALLAYAAVPLPYNALANGRLSALVAYAAAPWVLALLLRSTGIAPFGDDEDGAPGRWRRDVVVLGVVLAPVAALAPAALVMALVAGAGVAAGGAVAGRWERSGAALVAAVGGAGIAAVLLFPWTVELVLPGADPTALTGVGIPPGRAPGLGSLLRFETGPLGAPPVGWVFAAAAVLPLLVGRSWRLDWATRLWVVALTCWGVAWAGGRGWLPVDLPAPDVVLAPAAAAVALAIALGMVAFEADVPGYRFGWRQAACAAALVAVLLGTVPVAVSSLGGRWNLPQEDFADLLSWMPERRADGAFRVLWVGDPEVLPLRGWRLGEGVAYATSRGGPPDATALWPGASPGAMAAVGDALRVARASGTTALGHLLAPAAVRYVVVPLQAAPSTTPAEDRRPPADLRPALDAQVDLKRLAGDDALLVYENAAWAPGRAAVTPETAAASRDARLADLRNLELAGAPPVLPRRRSPTWFSGALQQGQHVLLSEASSSRWELRVAGRAAPRAEAFGWANLFTSPGEGAATLRYRTSPLRYAAVAVEVGLWVLAGRWVLARRREATAP